MADDKREEMMREAAEIFLRLRADPGNPELEAERDAFCARGRAEKSAYDEVLRTWTASGIMGAGRKLRSVVIAVVVMGLGFAVYEPLRIGYLADVTSRDTPLRTRITPVDTAILDADTAIADRSDATLRRIDVLEGAAVFEVAKEQRPFRVTIGDVTATVLGTAFETAFVDGGVAVAVLEGRVEVTADGRAWVLGAGDRLHWRDRADPRLTTLEPSDIATWRDNRLVLDGMTLGQATDIIARRISTPVVITHDALRETRVTGSLDLTTPRAALRVLAETAGGRMRDAAPLVTLITPR